MHRTIERWTTRHYWAESLLIQLISRQPHLLQRNFWTKTQPRSNFQPLTRPITLYIGTLYLQRVALIHTREQLFQAVLAKYAPKRVKRPVRGPLMGLQRVLADSSLSPRRLPSSLYLPRHACSRRLLLLKSLISFACIPLPLSRSLYFSRTLCLCLSTGIRAIRAFGRAHGGKRQHDRYNPIYSNYTCFTMFRECRLLDVWRVCRG